MSNANNALNNKNDASRTHHDGPCKVEVRESSRMSRTEALPRGKSAVWCLADASSVAALVGPYLFYDHVERIA